MCKQSEKAHCPQSVDSERAQRAITANAVCFHATNFIYLILKFTIMNEKETKKTPEEIGTLEFNNVKVTKVVETETFGKISLVLEGVNFPSYKGDTRINETNVIRLNPFTLLEQTRDFVRYLRRAGKYAGEKANKIDIWLWSGSLTGAEISFTRTFHEADEEREEVVDENGNAVTYGSPTWTTQITKVIPHYEDEEDLKADLAEFKEDCKAMKKATNKQTIIINPANVG